MNQQDYLMTRAAAESELRAEFPDLFSACDSLSCPPGWYTIARALSRQVWKVSQDVRVLQVKPKAGSLRYYYANSENSRSIEPLIALASAIAAHTCERCGNPGSQVGWDVLCSECNK